MKIAFDIKLMRPACPLVAAAMGADTDIANRFDPENWLLAPTPGMRVYKITESQVYELVRRMASGLDTHVVLA